MKKVVVNLEDVEALMPPGTTLVYTPHVPVSTRVRWGWILAVVLGVWLGMCLGGWLTFGLNNGGDF